MADAVVVTRNVFGTLILIIGIVLLVAGVAAFSYGTVDEQDNQDQFAPGRDRSDVNNALVAGGLAGGTLGLVLTIVGGIMVSRGNPNRIAVSNAPDNSKGKNAAASAAPPARQKGTPPAKSPAKTSAQKPRPEQPPISRKTLMIIGLSAVAIIFILGAVVLSGSGGGNLRGNAAPHVIADQSQTGTVPATSPFVLPGTNHGDTGDAIELPSHAKRVEVTLTWTPSATGPATLDLAVWHGASGTSTEVARASGSGEVTLTWTPEGKGAVWFVVETDDTHLSAQNFVVNWVFWDK